MRKLLPLVALVATLLLAAPAQAAVVHADGGAGGNNHKLLWTLDYDTDTKNVTLDVTHTKFDGSPAIGDPVRADLTVIRPNGQEQTFNLLTVVNPVDGLPGIINDGPVVLNVAGGLRVSANRASLIEFRTDYTPPVGT